MYRILAFISGITLMSVGLFFLILYLNLFTLGYSFGNFVKFIIRRPECFSFLVGLILVILSLGKERLNELFLRRFNKYERR